MILTHARRALATHPRVALALLLAFAVEILPAASGVVSHHHADGAHAHRHGGRILGGTAVRVAETPTDADRALRASAPAPDRHSHHVDLVVGIQASHAPTIGSTPLVSVLSAVPVSAVLVACRDATQARGPPLST